MFKRNYSNFPEMGTRIEKRGGGGGGGDSGGGDSGGDSGGDGGAGGDGDGGGGVEDLRLASYGPGNSS